MPILKNPDFILGSKRFRLRLFWGTMGEKQEFFRCDLIDTRYSADRRFVEILDWMRG